MKGGKAIASGSVGCLFKPPLKCRGDTERPKNYVSKLMTTSQADQEYEEIERILRYVRRVKNADDYFVLKDVKLCVPDDTLTKDDLDDFDYTCSFFRHENIYKGNLNLRIKQGKMKMLQLPDGGSTLYNVFSDGKMSKEEFSEVNRALIRLLVGGIIPLNKSQVIHADIKDTNIVYSLDTKKARLIDWGLSFHYESPDRAPNHELEQYSIMVNQPVTRLMFYRRFVSELDRFSKDSLVGSVERKTIGNLMPIYVDYLKSHFFSEDKERMKRTFDVFFDGEGHLSYIERLIYLLNRYVPDDDGTSVQDVLAKNIAKAYLTFSLMGGELKEFDENLFFNNVYRHNCDVFGFLYSYHQLMYSHRNVRHRLRFRLGKILMKYLYSDEFAGKRYDIKEIIRELRELDRIALDKESTFSPETYPTPSPASLRAPSPVPSPRSLSPVKVPSANVQSAKVPSATPTSKTRRRKRCDKGFRRDPKTGECVKVGEKKPKREKGSTAKPKSVTKTTQEPRKKPQSVKVKKTKPTTKVSSPEEIILSPSRKRCPRGYKIVKGTRKCRKEKVKE